jgi:hypothetical protein
MKCGACNHEGLPHAQSIADTFRKYCEGCWKCDRDCKAEQEAATAATADAEAE